MKWLTESTVWNGLDTQQKLQREFDNRDFTQTIIGFVVVDLVYYTTLV